MELFVLIGLVAIPFTILWIWALIDAIRVDDDRFKAGNTLIWVLVIVLTGWLGAIIYLLVGRPARGAST